MIKQKVDKIIRGFLAAIQDWYGWHYNARAIRNGENSIWCYLPSVILLPYLPIFYVVFGHRRKCRCSQYKTLIEMEGELI